MDFEEWQLTVWNPQSEVSSCKLFCKCAVYTATSWGPISGNDISAFCCFFFVMLLNVRNSYTERLYSQWNTVVFYPATNHRAELRDTNSRRFTTSHRPCFLDVRLCTSSLHIINVRNTCKCLCYSQTFVGFFSAMAESFHEGYNCFFISCVLEPKYSSSAWIVE